MFGYEFMGTAALILIGVGTSANIQLKTAKAFGTGYLMSALGWATGVFVGIVVSTPSGSHLNPAVTLAKALGESGELAPGVAATAGNITQYVVAQILGATVGATLAWLAYRDHYAPENRTVSSLAMFATVPAIRKLPQNFLTEVVATAVLIVALLKLADTPAELGPLYSALVVLAVGLGLGGPTGWAINPARDLGTRLAHWLLPIPEKGSSDWAYSWVPVAGPLVGAALGAVVLAIT